MNSPLEALISEDLVKRQGQRVVFAATSSICYASASSRQLRPV
jgi:hypothetical protein